MNQFQAWCVVATFNKPDEHNHPFRIPFYIDPRATFEVADAIGEQIARGIGANPLYVEQLSP